MKTIRVYIADADNAHVQRIAECMANRKDIEIVGRAKSGNEALKFLLTNTVDLLITDVQLPGLDGIMLLRDLQRMKRCPDAIVCTQFYSGMCVDYAQRFGASYVLYKPIDYHRLPEVIESCLENRRRRVLGPAQKKPEEEDRAQVVRKLLQRMGLSPRLSGSRYLSDALFHYDGDRSLVKNLSKGLYVQISEHMETTPACVERSLRTAIGAGYERGEMREHFKKRPSNRQFIEYLFDQMEQGG